MKSEDQYDIFQDNGERKGKKNQNQIHRDCISLNVSSNKKIETK